MQLHKRSRLIAAGMVGLVMAVCLCFASGSLALAISVADVDQGVVCKLAPKKASYKSGETVQFSLTTQYSTPGGSAPATMKYAINIPETTPAMQFPMFNRTGTGEYEGVPMCTLSFSGTSVDMYLVTLGDGSRRIEYTLEAGETIHGTISAILPNGISEPVEQLTFTPVILTPGSYSPQLVAGTTAVQAEFGWQDVVKVGSTNNLGVIGSTTKDPDRITYTVTADSLSSGIDTGRIFTERYTLTDTMAMTGLHYTDGTLTSSESGGVSSFFIAGEKVLEMDKPLSSLDVSKNVAAGNITSFTVVYSATNTTLGSSATATELANLDMDVTLFLAQMQLDAGDVDARLDNTAAFDAYSPFYDEGSGKTGAAYHDSSTATHIAYTTDNYEITKQAFLDAGCTQPARTPIEDGDYLFYKIVAGNDRTSPGTFTIEDILPDGMVYDGYSGTTAPMTQNGQTLTWSNVSIASGGTCAIVVKATLDITKLTGPGDLHNVANLYSGSLLVASDSVDNKFVSGEVTDTDIVYEKKASAQAAGVDDPLTYTITVRNSNASVPKLITVVDKWPGTSIMPTAVTGCESFKLLDARGTEYTLAQVQADPSIVITQIKCYNVFVPAGGSTQLTISGSVTAAFDELTNSVGSGAGEVTAKAYGVSLRKDVYKYDEITHTISSSPLSIRDAIVANDVVCYVMTVKNLKSRTVSVNLFDKLPAGLTLVSKEHLGVTGTALLQRGNATPVVLGIGSDTTTGFPKTDSVSLAAGETARIYLFATVSQAAINASLTTGNKIVNAAYLTFNSVTTGDATANIYTNNDGTPKLYVDKTASFVADYDDDTLGYTGTKILNQDGTDYQQSRTFWPGAYVGYSIQIKNSNTPEVSLYEVIDTLPEGMELVAVSLDGTRNIYNPAYGGSAPESLASEEWIRDGESGTYRSEVYNGNSLYTAKITCSYDAATRQVHILYNDGDKDNPLRLLGYAGDDNNYQKPCLNIVARIADDVTQTNFTNTVDVRTDKSVKAIEEHGCTSIIVGEFAYIRNSVQNGILSQAPGITKQMVGDASNISPGDPLRFLVQVKNQDNSTNIALERDINRNSLADFTVVDYLPAEYVYKAGSTEVRLNATYLKASGVADVVPVASIQLEPTVEQLTDGRTKLTWTFAGKELRLFDQKSATLGYMHMIEYVAEWNPGYDYTYGSYTNSAEVIHSEGFRSVSTGAPDYDMKSVAASTVVNVFGAAGTSALKSVTNSSGGTANGNDTVNTVSTTGTGDRLTYTMSVKNSAAAATTYTESLVLIDELPRATGDTGVVNRTDRGSEFPVLFDSSPNVTVKLKLQSADPRDPAVDVDPSNYTVHYGMSTGGLNANGDWSQAETGGRVAWGTSSEGMNAIRVAFADGYRIEQGCTIIVTFQAEVGDGADPGETAWNSFGYSYRPVIDGTTEAKIYSEPLRVGATVPGATLTVAKTVTGDPAPVAAEFPFVLKQGGTALVGAKYTLNDSDEVLRTGTGGSFTLKAGQTATFYVAPGAGYAVEEGDLPPNFTFDSAAAAAAGDGSVPDPARAPTVFSFKTLAAGGTAGAVYTNFYIAPPTIDLTVTKVWAGTTDPNQPTSVSAQLYGNGTAAGSPVTLNAGNLWQYTWTDLDNSGNTTWTVEEVSTLPDGYVSVVSGDSVNGYTITNTYTAPPISVTATKVWAGDADPARPTSVQLQLYGNSVAYNTPKTVGLDGTWSYTWGGLDPAVTWTVREVTDLGVDYSTRIDGDTMSGFTVTNTYTTPQPTTTSVAVRKDWAGDPNPDQPASVEVQLYKDGRAFGDAATLDASSNWAHVWRALDINATWTVAETSALPAGYSSVLSGNAIDGYVITNTYTDPSKGGGGGVATGDDVRPFIWVVVLLGVGAALAGASRIVKRKRR